MIRTVSLDRSEENSRVCAHAEGVADSLLIDIDHKSAEALYDFLSKVIDAQEVKND